MKKLLSVVLALMLVLTALPTFAADSAIGATEFENGTEYEYNLKTLNNGAWDVESTLTKNLKYTADVNQGSMAIFKLPVPELADGQGFSNYTFKFCDSKEASNRGTHFRVVGLEGINEEALKDGSLTTKDEPVASALNVKNYNDATILDAALEATEEAFNATSYYTYKANITSYANECLEAGNDAIYVGVYAMYSYGVFGYGDGSSTGCRVPYVYFTADDAATIPDNPAEPEPEPEVPFDHTLEGYRGVGNKTKVDGSYMVDAGVPAEATGNVTSSYISGKGKFAVYKIALPKVEDGEGYEHFIISTGCGSAATFIMMPGENWDFTKSLADTFWYKNITAAATVAEYKANDAAVLCEETIHYNIYLADITTYANQCLNAGQEYMYLAAGAWSSTSNVALSTMTDSGYVGAGNYPHYYYRVGEAVETPDFPPMEEEAPEVPGYEEPTVPFDHTLEGYKGLGNITAVPESYKVAGGVPAAASGNWGSAYMSGKGHFAIYKIPVPQAPEGKEIDHVVLRFGGSKVSMRVFKMPGTDWDFTKSLADTDWYKAVTVAATSEAYYANDAKILVEEGNSYNNFYADITTYVKECALAGQEYFYIVATSWNSTANVGLSTMTDSSFVGAGHKPHYSYSFADKEIKFLSSSVADGAYVADVDSAIDFEFTDAVASANVTINGTAVDATVDGRKVSVTGLAKGVANVITVTAKDAYGKEATVSITVNGYGKAKIAKSTYVVNGVGSTPGTYNPSASYVSTVIFQIPLPEVADGKEIDSFIFNFLTPKALGNVFQLVKLPGEDWDVTKLVQTNDEVPEGLTNIASYTLDALSYKYVNKATRAKITTEKVDIAPSAKNDDGKSNLNHANLSQYARECIANGQSTMWLAVRSDSTVAITGVGDSSHSGAGRFHTVEWTFKDAEETIAAPKAVLATENASYDDAEGVTVLAKDTEYKFITKANIEGQLVVAKYDANGKFVSVDAVELGGTGADDQTKAFKTGDAEGFVKVFVWAKDTMAPVDDDITILAIK